MVEPKRPPGWPREDRFTVEKGNLKKLTPRQQQEQAEKYRRIQEEARKRAEEQRGE